MTVLYSGAMGAKQGLDIVLQAAALLERETAPTPQAIAFVLRGEGNGAAALKAEAHRLGLTHLRFEPLAAAQALSDAMAEGHVHLVPQRREGAAFALPSKVLAAMAAGRPFVATAEPGTDLAVLASVSGSGLVVAPGDPEALAEALARLAAEPARRTAMGAAGRRYLETHLSRETVCQNLLSAVLASEPASRDP